MNITISKTNAYSKEEVSIVLNNGTSEPIVKKLENLTENERNLVNQFCQANAHKTVSISQAYAGVEVSIKLVNIELSDDPKTIENILEPSKIQSTGMFLDLFTNLVFDESIEA
jgi:hypothetical protein